jgi:hypothetical protein
MWIYNVVVLGFLPVEKFPDLMKGEKRFVSFLRAVIKKMQKYLPIHTFLKFCKKSR